MSETKTKLEFVLPDAITKAEGKDPRDLVVVSQPKMGKSAILGDFSVKTNALVLNLEKGGYEYIDARKIDIHSDQSTSEYEAFNNFVRIRNLLLKEKGKYDVLIIDGLSDLDAMSEIGGTLAYMESTIGKKFNIIPPKLAKKYPGKEKFDVEDPEWRSVNTLPEGYGYQHSRKWFLQQIEIFRQIAPYRIYAAHVADKYIKEQGKEDVVGNELFLTGALKRILPTKVTALCKLIADGDKRYLNFEVLNDSIIAGSRAPWLKDKILISEKNTDDTITTHWDNIYKQILK